jgi:hypothetical protein
MSQYSEKEIQVDFESVQAAKNRWYQVEKLIHSILNFVYDHGIRITSVTPFGLIPFDMYYSKKELEEARDNFPYADLRLKRIPGKEKKVNQSEFEGIPSSNSKIYHATSKETIKRHKKAYAKMKKLNASYKKDRKEGRTKKENPSVDDYREALIPIFHREVCPRTIKRIQEEGKEGFLK